VVVVTCPPVVDDQMLALSRHMQAV
jgi:hypothetical protein